MNDELVGRAVERAAIDALLDHARNGVADALLLAGPAGIGKSALVRYALAHAAGFRVVRIVGVESEMAFGFAGVHQAALQLADSMDALPRPQRAALDGVLANAPHEVRDPFLVGLSVLTLVAEMAKAEPVLAVIDDAQWLDDESAMAFSFVGHRLAAERVASLVTMRDAPLPLRHFQTIPRLEVGGLSRDESLTVLRDAAPGAIDDSVADQIVDASEGNPLALVELPGVLSAAQLRGAQPLPDPLPIGGRLSGVFAARIRAVDDGTRTVLLLASAERLGDPRLLRRAADAVGGLSWDDAVASAEASGLVTFTPAVRFRHPLVRSAVYYSASALERRRAHAALADALDAELDADRRAWHLAAAADGPDEAVARALEASAERARQRGGASGAAYFLWRAAELTPDPGRAAERLLEAARAELVGGRGSRAQEILDQARSLGLADRLHAEAAWTEALIHIADGEVRAPATLLAEALPAVAADEPELGAGASVAAQAAAVTGGYLVDTATRQAIATGTWGVVDRCALPAPIDHVLVGLADLHAGDRVGAIETLRAAVQVAVADQDELRRAVGFMSCTSTPSSRPPRCSTSRRGRHSPRSGPSSPAAWARCRRSRWPSASERGSRCCKAGSGRRRRTSRRSTTSSR